MSGSRSSWVVVACLGLLAGDKISPTPRPEPQAHTDLLGDPLPPGAIARLGTVRFRHEGALFAIAFAPGGTTLATGGVQLLLWDLQSGKTIRSFPGHTSWISALAFGRDGTTLVSASADTTLRLWDVATGKQLRKFVGHREWVTALALSADGHTLVSGSNDRTVRVWDVATGQERRRLQGHADWVYCVALSPDGRTVASGSDDKTIRLWDIATGKQLRRLEGHLEGVQAVAFAPDGKTLASGSRDGTVRLWPLVSSNGRPPTSASQRVLGKHAGHVSCVVFSSDGKYLASASADHARKHRQDSLIRLWDMATGKQIREFAGHQDGVFAVAFSPDDRLLASASRDQVIRLWDRATGAERRPFSGHQGAVECVAYSPDGRTVASGSWDRSILVWDHAKHRERCRLVGHTDFIKSIAFCPDGRTLVSASLDKTVRLWDVTTGRTVRPFEGHQSGVFSVAVAPDGKMLASGGFDNTIILWDLATGKPLRHCEGHAGPVSSLTFSPDGQALASGSYDQTVRLWDVATGQELRPIGGHNDGVLGIAFSPDGKTLASVSADKRLYLTETATGRLRLQLTGEICVAFAGGGRLLATGGDRRLIHVLDVARGVELTHFQGHRGDLECLAFAPDCKTLVSGSSDTTLLAWNVDGLLPHQPAGGKLTQAELEALWQDLESEDAARAYQAIWRLVAVPGPASAFLRGRLQPVPHTDPRRVSQLLLDLDDNRFAVRQRAARQLENLGEVVETALRKELERRPSLEVRRRIEWLLKKREGKMLSQDALRVSRAEEVLGQIGSGDARAILARLAQGEPEARVTQEAKLAVQRLRRAQDGAP
jgi:WD40 repeat protein